MTATFRVTDMHLNMPMNIAEGTESFLYQHNQPRESQRLRDKQPHTDARWLIAVSTYG